MLIVQDTLQDYDVFITGASGFVGIALLEKLLYVHSEANHGNIRNMDKSIYLLIRSNKKYSNVETRLINEMLTNSLFDSYNKVDLIYLVKNKRKIVAIKG
eukprot:12250_1